MLICEKRRVCLIYETRTTQTTTAHVAASATSTVPLSLWSGHVLACKPAPAAAPESQFPLPPPPSRQPFIPLGVLLTSPSFLHRFLSALSLVSARFTFPLRKPQTAATSVASKEFIIC
jgi:hypothetical protein